MEIVLSKFFMIILAFMIIIPIVSSLSNNTVKRRAFSKRFGVFVKTQVAPFKTITMTLCSSSTASGTGENEDITTNSTASGPTENDLKFTVNAKEDGAVVHIYPYDTSKDIILQNGQYDSSNIKVLHLIRHAEGTHNVNKQYRDIINLDAKLTEKGIQQCQQLNEKIKNSDTTDNNNNNNNYYYFPLYDLLKQTDLIVTSPLTRCIQTTLLSLQYVIQQRKPIIIANEDIRETVNYNCDRRRNITDLIQCNDIISLLQSLHENDNDNVDNNNSYKPTIDFTHIKYDHDHIWDKYVERLGCDETWIQHRESAEIHVVAERGRNFFNWLQQRPEQHIIVCTHSAYLRCIKNFGIITPIPMQPKQLLVSQDNDDNDNKPVIQYIGNDEFARSLQKDYENCELRSMIIAFPTK